MRVLKNFGLMRVLRVLRNFGLIYVRFEGFCIMLKAKRILFMRGELSIARKCGNYPVPNGIIPFQFNLRLANC